MSISLILDLNDRDLAHFQDAMEAARAAAAGKGEAEIVECASKLLVEARGEQVPDFIMDRLLRMHRRRERDRDAGAGYGKSSGYASGKRTYADRGWRPALFRAG